MCDYVYVCVYMYMIIDDMCGCGCQDVYVCVYASMRVYRHIWKNKWDCERLSVTEQIVVGNVSIIPTPFKELQIGYSYLTDRSCV